MKQFHSMTPLLLLPLLLPCIHSHSLTLVCPLPFAYIMCYAVAMCCCHCVSLSFPTRWLHTHCHDHIHSSGLLLLCIIVMYHLSSTFSILPIICPHHCDCSWSCVAYSSHPPVCFLTRGQGTLFVITVA